MDRHAVVRRHNPVLGAFQPRSPLSIGNGEFAFTADITGLQTFPDLYDKAMPLCTMSHWGWHSFPNPRGYSLATLKLTDFETHGRKVGYPVAARGQEEHYNWLRDNPHRLHLGRIGFVLKTSTAADATPQDLTGIRQELDLFRGHLSSSFQINGRYVHVHTVCHPDRDAIAIDVRSELITRGQLALRLDFPYGSPAMNAADWTHPDRHTTTLEERGINEAIFHRRLDDDRYAVRLFWFQSANLEQAAPHSFRLLPLTNHLSATIIFEPIPGTGKLSFRETFGKSQDHWKKFWTTGAAIDLSASTDPRARELERRIVLSQYQTAIQSSGSLPPQETGLVCNSWNGKFHMEMYWWHSAHFPMWGRPALLERSMSWYNRTVASARATAKQQGYAGARWPKMVAPDGRESPSSIGPLLIWQQAHPIAMAELLYRATPTRATLDRYRDIVMASAEFMASFAHLETKTGRYVLGPPVIPAQENHPPTETWNPTYELEYWAYGLRIANEWRRRLSLPPEPKWEEIRRKLAPLPAKDGVYLAHENCPRTFTERNRDHPSMVAALGVLPGEKADKETMRRTLRKVMDVWEWPDTWGWDYPMIAMTAARIGEPALAIDALMLNTPKNEWLANGHTYQRTNLPLYLPSNGGLLAAIAMMAAGWEGGLATNAAGFPSNWNVRHEGLLLQPL
ncbi:MAG: glycoside hydrolase family 65 [Acidobacteria bacterium]|nr:glycoside hydrolase family 65 [Acidobacteriota bacterium]